MSRMRYVVVAGHSSSGKREFIDRFREEPREWSRRLDLDPVTNAEIISTDEPVEEIESLARRCDCVLAHWQSRSFERVRQLYDRNDSTEIVVVHVMREINEHRKCFEKEHPTGEYSNGLLLNVSRVEEYRKFVHVFVDVANLDGEFHVIGITRRS